MPVIEVDSVSKLYRLGASRTSLREALSNSARRLLHRGHNPDGDQLFWALKDVSFSIDDGEVLGIIGHNGAGKSTTLKLLSKVIFPTSGQIRTRGRMAALIELGAGFHPDLSGRENIYLNGSILGLKQREIDAQFDSMVEFAGLEKFIDTPVKRYSSGMYVRLAFAVAAHVRADLLLIDEVLSVGDLNFQQKCLNKMRELRDSGATIIFISHNLWSVSSFCGRVLLLSRGSIVADGEPNTVIETYRQLDRAEALARVEARKSQGDQHDALLSPEQEGDAVITRVDLLDEAGAPEQLFRPKDRLVVRCSYHARRPIETPMFVVRVRRSDGLLCCALPNPAHETHPINGEGSFEVCIGPLHLLPDIYSIQVLIANRTMPIVYAASINEPFRIDGRFSEDDEGVFEPDTEWSMVRR